MLNKLLPLCLALVAAAVHASPEQDPLAALLASRGLVALEPGCPQTKTAIQPCVGRKHPPFAHLLFAPIFHGNAVVV